MSKSPLGLLALTVAGYLLLVGCTPQRPPGTPTTEAFFLTQTAYVQALRASRTATARARPTATPTFTPTATATATPTPTPPRPEATPEALRVRVQGHLFCRNGPAPYYRALAVLEPGQVLQAVGRNPVYYNYLILALPNGTRCWAWTRWLQMEGDIALLEQLPVMTPPPPPAAAYTYPRQNPVMLPFCPVLRSSALQVQVTNRGWKPLASLDAEITVLESGARYRTVFSHGIPTCTQVLDHIQPGGTVAIALRTRQNLLEKRVRIYIKMCTQPEFRGECAAYAVIWTIPKPVPVFPFPFRR